MRKGRVAAFAVERAGGEAIGIAAEVGRGARRRQATEALVRAIREAVADACGETPTVVTLLNPGALPRTSSGKLRRSEALRQYLSGELAAPRELSSIGVAREMVKSVFAFARMKIDQGS